ncbi:MAG: hypothetical protein J6Z18_06435 [Prevotella sp.]|nr:hypothetical protein [Prevotella sp.]
MKKLVLLTILMGVLPLSMMAQDDMYFTPKKGAKEAKSAAVSKVNDDKPVYHTGSNRNVDEYNRRGKFGSYFEKIGTDSLGNDIIEFHSSAEDLSDTLNVYPYESVQYDPEDDYLYSRRMNWFDDFYWYDPWYFRYSGYNPYFYGRWGWWDPWFTGYYGWYGGWYDPLFYGWGGRFDYYWGRPYGYGYYGWGIPSYHVSYGNSVTGTSNHGYVSRPASRNTAVTAGRGHFGGYRGNGQTTQTYNRTRAAASSNSNMNRGNGRFVGSTSNSNNSSTRSYTPSYSGGSYSSGGGSFGGSSGGSSGGGGGRSGGSSGGGHFGGRR